MILSDFGFSRVVYNYKRTESFDWLDQLYNERRKETLTEIESSFFEKVIGFSIVC